MIAQLYEVPPDRFNAARDALAASLRAEGRAAEAKRVSRLRRPAPAVWLANAAARSDRGKVEALIAAGGQPQTGGIPGSRGQPELKRALSLLSDAALKAAREARMPWSLTVRRRVEGTLQAAAAQAPDALRAAELEHELAPGIAGARLAVSKARQSSQAVREHVALRRDEIQRKAAEKADQFRRTAGERTQQMREAVAVATGKRREAARAQKTKIVSEQELQSARRDARQLRSRAEHMEKAVRGLEEELRKAQRRAAAARREADAAAARIHELTSRR